MHQLTTDPLTVVAQDIYVCENPAVLRAAAAELAESCAPLICTEGQPSAACHKLLATTRARIHWRGDFDWTGLRTTTTAINRYHATPWRMATTDYLTAPSPWDPQLAGEMTERGRAVMEERLIPPCSATWSWDDHRNGKPTLEYERGLPILVIMPPVWPGRAGSQRSRRPAGRPGRAR